MNHKKQKQKKMKSSTLNILTVTVLLSMTGPQAQSLTCQKIFPVKHPANTGYLPKTLRFLSFNMENLTQVNLGSSPKRPFRNQQAKPEKETMGVADVLLDVQPDIVLAQEIFRRQALNHLDDQHTGNSYDTIFRHGNDPRGIHLAQMVKKGLPLEFKTISHHNLKWSNPFRGGTEQPLFSRDLPVTLVFIKGVKSPVLIYANMHAKSKRIGDTELPGEGAAIRKAQMEGTARILKQFQAKYGEDIPMLVAGDFNSDVNKENDVAPLRQFLRNAFDVLNPPVSSRDRTTHVFIETDKVSDKQTIHNDQMDAFFVNAAFEKFIINSYVYRYRDQSYQLPLPKSYEDKKDLPSDHYPIVLEIDFQGLLEARMGKN